MLEVSIILADKSSWPAVQVDPETYNLIQNVGRQIVRGGDQVSAAAIVVKRAVEVIALARYTVEDLPPSNPS